MAPPVGRGGRKAQRIKSYIDTIERTPWLPLATRASPLQSPAAEKIKTEKNTTTKKKPNTTPFHQPHLLRTRIPFYGSPREKLAAVTSSRLPFKEARNFKDVIDPRDVSARHAKETHPSTRTPSADVREWRGRTGTSTAGVAYLTSPLWEEHATGKLETYVADSCYVNYWSVLPPHPPFSLSRTRFLPALPFRNSGTRIAMTYMAVGQVLCFQRKIASLESMNEGFIYFFFDFVLKFYAVWQQSWPVKQADKLEKDFTVWEILSLSFFHPPPSSFSSLCFGDLRK